jgi:hypothetical protein
MTPITFTIARNKRGPLGKSFALHDGRLQQAPKAELFDGLATQAAVEDLHGFSEALKSLRPTEALTFGIPRLDRAHITTQKAVEKGRAPSGAIARNRENFAWPKGRAILMLDIDRPKDGGKPLRPAEFDNDLRALLPWWSKSARLYRPSASAFIYDAETGEELSGPGSMRCYAIVDKGENIPFVGIAILDALWKAGRGRIEFNAAGAMMVRTAVDASVWQPERLDFAGPSILGPGLMQERKPPIIIDGQDIDTEAAIAAGPGRMTFAAWASNSLEVRKAKHAARPEEKRRRRAFVDERVKDDVAKGISEPEARRKWSAALKTQELSGAFELHFSDIGRVTVADVLRDLAKFDRRRLADPLEPNYRDDPRIAQFYANVGHGRPSIFSHCHGGVKYSLRGT